MDIMLRAFWRSGNFKNTRRWIRGRVLLTGSTGFLGGFLLRDLLRLTKVMNTFMFFVIYFIFLTQINAWNYSLNFRFTDNGNSVKFKTLKTTAALIRLSFATKESFFAFRK